ncbi:MAG: MFS transporter [Gammaproteobacteria bacterium]|nr:MFS transporter [Gammaproteobacteria bacterium]
MISNRVELKLISAILTGILLSNLSIFSAPFYIGALIDGLGLNAIQAGLVNTFEIGAVAGVTLVFANYVDRISLRYLALTGALIILLANLVSLTIDGYLPMLLIRTLAGTGAGLCLAASSALLSRMKDPDRVMGIVLVCNTLTLIVLLSIMGYAKQQWMFSGVIGLLTIVLLLMIPLMLFIPTRPVVAHKAETADSNMDINRAIGLLGIGLLIVFCLIEGGVLSFSERVATRLGISETDIGKLLALAYAAGLAGASLVALLGDKIPRIFPICTGISLMGIASLVVYHTQSNLLFSIFLCSFTFGFFIAFPYLIGACARLDSNGYWAARASGANLIGVAFAPFMAGTIVSTTSYQTLGLLCFCLALVCLVLALVFNYRIKQQLCETRVPLT